ncbi:HEAT repeat domain-containing protein [Gloeobacter morelensis]|uniref:HEAT repeat domain-containing protein n=1 Tax=Gloeobacter morelensis MG652769 TaxID=2781736 RepID=A0ABY3PGQ4_9CYAN|nr:HEAT repeat domain-containing protein [Gloeobacter morelensis]UFP92718.1 HEAT repeat domain-containing protein [Gloeobacter morelensis MG652769]
MVFDNLNKEFLCFFILATCSALLALEGGAVFAQKSVNNSSSSIPFVTEEISPDQTNSRHSNMVFLQRRKLKVLEKDLESKDVSSRMFAAAEIKRLMFVSAEAKPILVKVISKDENGSVRANATYSLGFLASVDKDASMLPFFIQTLQNDMYANTRVRAIGALGRMKLWTPPVIDVLANALDDRDTQVRASAALVLGEAGEAAQQTIPALESMKAQGGYVGEAADKALRKIRR